MSRRRRLSRRFPSALMGWRNLGRHRIRTALAALGIVIGVVAIASLGMVGAAISYQADQNLGTLTNEITITPGQENLREGLTETEVREIEQVVTEGTVVPQKTDQVLLSANGERVRARVVGVTRASALYEAVAGEVPDRLSSGALVNENLADDLSLSLGDPVTYNGQLYRIRGITESPQTFGGGGSVLVLPVEALSAEPLYPTVTVVTAVDGSAAAIADAIEARLNERQEVVSTFTLASVQDQIDTFLNTLNLALLGIGSISLFVASVAVLNVMLMSTIERRGEIGLLRAVGIRRREVLRMILTEAAFLGVVGGVVGVIGSLLIGLVMFDLVAGDAFLVLTWESARYLVFGFVFAVGSSLLSGIYPAWKAANNRPVDSLRG